ncbi:MAG TPA: sugar-transfer associated ATP-grasp domain-containing protein [Aequorivita sp.]|nr:sugar-transfer associated ATP-grasp domain-containing protein [Aequorivita sp.]
MYKRTLYLGYYLRKLNRPLFKKFLSYSSQQTGISKMRLIADAIYSVYKYNISLLEYFQFRFFEKNHIERSKWAGTGFMYEFQLKMNPKANREILENKVTFFEHFGKLTGRNYATLEELKNHDKNIGIFNNTLKKIVIKETEGGCGKGLEVLELSNLSQEDLINRMEKTGNHLAEDFVEQHDSINKLSPSGLNTIRVITQIDKNGKTLIIDARLRISINSIVDNMAAGNIVVGIDADSGVVFTKGVYSDITKESITHHPVSGVSLIGFQVPFWKEVVELTINSAESIAQYNKSVGWDIAITNEGPILIEGNHDWCKLVWQLPVQEGLKSKLEKYA